MTLWTAEAARAATGGQATRDWQATGVSIDTRSLEQGDLFVALTDQRDGHDFVADALTKGAAAALVSRIPEGVPADAPLLVVEDVLAALERLGAAARARTRARVIAVTGSAGKTSTKEMLRVILDAQGRVHAADKSFNNHWGVPLTLARMPADADYAVIEIGMNNPGEIAPLSRLTRPHIALITTIAAAHLQAFDDLDGIAAEKATIFDGLEPGGIAVIDADAPGFAVMEARARACADRLVTFGAQSGDVRLMRVDFAADTTIVRATGLEGQVVLFKVGVAGRHFAHNGLAALTVAELAGADPAVAQADIAAWRPPAGRGTRERVVLDPVEDFALTLIDDAFNANPASIAAALEVLAAAEPMDGMGRVSAGRRIAILGDMLELGPDEIAMHRAIADHPGMAAVARVHCVGPRMAALWDALPEEKRGRRVDTAEELAAAAHSVVDAGDVVLVKGSKGSRVSLVVDAIRKLGQARAPLPAAGA